MLVRASSGSHRCYQYNTFPPACKGKLLLSASFPALFPHAAFLPFRPLFFHGDPPYSWALPLCANRGWGAAFSFPGTFSLSLRPSSSACVVRSTAAYCSSVQTGGAAAPSAFPGTLSPPPFLFARVVHSTTAYCSSVQTGDVAARPPFPVLPSSLSARFSCIQVRSTAARCPSPQKPGLVSFLPCLPVNKILLWTSRSLTLFHLQAVPAVTGVAGVPHFLPVAKRLSEKIFLWKAA